MVNIGIIGLGWMGQLHAKYLQHVRGARLAAVCDMDEQRAQAVSQQYGVAAYTDYEKMLESDVVDAVYIVVPQQYHYKVACHCIEAHKHILCEKPLGLNRSELSSLREKLSGYDRKFLVDFPERFTVSCQEAMVEIGAGHVGRIDFMRGNFRFSMKNHDKTPRCLGIRPGYRRRFDLESSVHMWDMVRHVTGCEVTQISAVAHEYNIDNRALEDNFVAIGQLDNGGIVCIDMSGSLPTNAPTDKRFEVIGSEGMVYIDEFRNLLTVMSEQPVENNPGMFAQGMTYKDLLWHSEIAGGVMRLQQHFVDVIEHDLPSIPGFEDGCRATEITWAILESLNSGKTEKVRYDGKV